MKLVLQSVGFNQRIFSSILVITFILFSCKGKEEMEDKPEPKEKKKIESEIEKPVEVLFDATTFSDDQSLQLLRELGEGICNPAEKDLENYIRPACNAKFFKFFPFKENTQMKDAFILLIKSKVHGFPIRRTFVYQREKGKLVKVNGFAANLIGMQKSKNGHDDLILRFADRDQNHFNCVFVWRSNHYEFDKVSEINDSKVKAEFQDSMNVEINKELELNGLQKI